MKYLVENVFIISSYDSAFKTLFLICSLTSHPLTKTYFLHLSSSHFFNGRHTGRVGRSMSQQVFDDFALVAVWRVYAKNDFNGFFPDMKIVNFTIHSQHFSYKTREKVQVKVSSIIEHFNNFSSCGPVTDSSL